MAFDGISTKNVLIELNKNLINARVEKIYVPTKNDIFFYFHTQNRENLKLLISIDANNARLHFSNNVKENPVKAPQICMIFRKHLQGAKLLCIKQHGLDRIIIFTFQNFNEMGDLVERNLVVELMGKYSNVILTNEHNKIIDSMKHVDITMSSVREVLPNKSYIFPTTLGKISFEDCSFEEFKNSLLKQDSSIMLSSKITNSFVGFGKSFASNLLLDLKILETSQDDNDFKRLYDYLNTFFKTLKSNSFDFKVLKDGKDYILSDNISTKNFALSDFLDSFYSKKEKVSLIKVAKLNIERDVNAHISKLNKKLNIVNETIDESEDFEKYKQYGELLNCNMHLLKIGMDSISVINFYDNNNELVIPLKKNLSPSKNAQNYFKKYNKSKSAILHATKYKKEYEADINYLNSVLCELYLAEDLTEIDDIRDELIQEGYIKKLSKTKFKKQDAPSEPIKYEVDGVEILVGRNNIQNDRLTFKIAKKSYTWLHTKNIHGSHVIIKSDVVSDNLLYEAAKLAVKHSQGKNSSKVEVDYTLVKYVHKEIGSKPGMVVYTNYHTIIV